MKKAIQLWYNEDFEAKCFMASAAGFKHIAVNFNLLLDKDKNFFEKAPGHILSVFERCGLECVQTHLPYYDLRISSEKLDDKMESYMKTSIEISGKIGSPFCVYHPRSSITGGFTRAKSFEDNRKTLSEYLEVAVKNGTGIAVENLPIFDGIVPVMPFYSSDFSDLAELTDSFNDEKMKICWDFGHANLMNFSQNYAIEYLGKRIVCTHIHNNRGKHDSHLTPDQGTIKWDEIMPAMKFVHESCPLTLETDWSYTDDRLFQSFLNHNYQCVEYLERLI